MDRSRQIQEIVNDCLQRWSEGKVVHEAEVLDRHPELAPELAEELRKVRLVAQAELAAAEPAETLPSDRPARQRDGLRVRCPHCRNAMEVLDDSAELRCESCGGGISFSDPEGEYSAAPKRLGHFRLESMLGTGAFGSVWKAYDEELDRYVAIKIPRRSQLDPAQSEQFFREARIAAQIDHPNIVSVHEVGRDADTVFIVSDLVPGIPLSQWMQQRTLSVKEIASLCQTLAESLQHAHARGVIHRDLKPANVMIDLQDAPHIMDFGLAKRNVGEITMTADGQVLGTPAYMSPEQARGDAHHVDGRSDVYSLGVMLFELLTGELPFRGSAGMLIDQVMRDEPPSPRRLSNNVPRDLETICLKCLAKNRTSRYASAKHLADELGRFQRGEPILARPISRIDRAWRWCHRYPMAAIAIALIAFLAVAGPLLAWHERSLRQELDLRYRERTAMIRELNAKRGDLEVQIGDLRRRVASTDVQSSVLESIASAAVQQMDTQPLKKMSIKRLLAMGVILASQDRSSQAIDALELAAQRLSEREEASEPSNLLLAHADCCVRLSRLYRTLDPAKSVEKAREAEKLAANVLLSAPSVAAYAVRIQARSCLALALGNAGDTKGSIEVLLSSKEQADELQAVIPTSEDEVYAMACDYFSNLPRLLP